MATFTDFSSDKGALTCKASSVTAKEPDHPNLATQPRLPYECKFTLILELIIGFNLKYLHTEYQSPPIIGTTSIRDGEIIPQCQVDVAATTVLSMLNLQQISQPYICSSQSQIV